MSNIQVKDVPEALHHRLTQTARRQQCTISAFLLTAVQRELARLERQARIARRPETNLGVSAASLLEQERRDPVCD